MTLTLSPVLDIPMIQPGDDLGKIIFQALEAMSLKLQEGDILVLAQKIVSKAEGRLFNLTQVEPSARALELAEKTEKDPRFVELVLRESSEVLRTRPGTIIVEHKHGFVCANAGIDHSNVRGPWGNSEDWVLLLPDDPDASAERVRQRICELSGMKSLGILIIDSHGRAWRNGTVGVAIGLAEVPGIVDMRGKPDLFGYRLRITMIAAADELAAAASLVMGQADECQPVIHVRGFPYALRESHLKELIRAKELDMFR
ncbi:MAG: coenzyme F420-0:L-glutamate ligase [Chloroflexi bacterium]|nr:MAG: coenzyme F420-0:L-glutamate ligase [Chloroflexota bacterium]